MTRFDAWLSTEPEPIFDFHNPFEGMKVEVPLEQEYLEMAAQFVVAADKPLDEAFRQTIRNFIRDGVEERWAIHDWRRGADSEPLLLLPGYLDEEIGSIVSALNATVPDTHCVDGAGQCSICRDVVMLPSEALILRKVSTSVQAEPFYVLEYVEPLA